MRIDINCDVGEGIANEALLFPYISSCNIACGGHFGNATTIDKTLQLAMHHDVRIGVHPSFPDKENFGRQVLQISDKKLVESIQVQLELFLKRLSLHNLQLHHIKPHGALYNLIAVDENKAIVFIKAIKKYSKNVFLYVPYNSVIERIALKNKIRIKYEAFADRNYTKNGTLVARTANEAILKDPKKVFEHIYSMLTKGIVKTNIGSKIKIKSDTFCIHGDHKNSIEILEYLTKELTAKGIKIGY